MTEVYLRIGQAAAELGVTIHQLRKLCETGRIEADRTPGGQWRIPLAEVERLKKDGLPAVPVGLPGEDSATNGRNGKQNPPQRPGSALLAPPSPAATGAVEEALISENRVKVKENQVKAAKLDRELDETQEYWRAKDRREAEDEEARRWREREEQEEEQRRFADEQAAQRRQEWRDDQIAYALRWMDWNASDAPEATRLEVVEQVERTLEKLDPSRNEANTRRLVDTAIQLVIAPWRKEMQTEKQKQEAIDAALLWLDYNMKSDPEWNNRLHQAAAEAIRDDMTVSQMLVAAKAAVQPVIKDYEQEKLRQQHVEQCRDMVNRAHWDLDNPTTDESEGAKDAVRTALGALPVGASQRQREQARDTAVQPIKERIAVRRDDEMREDVISWLDRYLSYSISNELRKTAVEELRRAIAALPQCTPRRQLEQLRDRTAERYKKAHEVRQQKEDQVDSGLRQIYPYILRLEKEYEFDKGAYSLEAEIREPIRQALWEELTGKETPEQVSGIVRRLVREELEL